MANEISYSDPISAALIQQLLKGGGSQVSTTTQTGGTVDPAALAQLQTILAGFGSGAGAVTTDGVPQVSNQISPEQLAAIFSQGAQQIPNLTAAFANAAGARSSNNSGLRLALTDLNEGLTRQAALLGQEQQKLSTDAAYKNASLGLNAAQIQAQMEMAAMQAEAQLAAAMAQLQRSPQQTTQVTRQTGGISPEKLLLGGFALNQASKGNWLDRIFGNKENVGESYANPSDAAMINLPSTSLPEVPSMDPLSPISWDLPSFQLNNFDLGGFDSFTLPNIDVPSFSFPEFGASWTDYSLPDFSFNFGDFGYGDIGSSLDAFDFGPQDFNFFGDGFFADGGQPARRNKANMGSPGVRRVSGVATRDPALSPGLIAKINMPARPQIQGPDFGALVEAMMARRQQQQQQQRAPADKPFEERDRTDSGNDSMEAPTSMPFSQPLASSVKAALQLGGLLAAFGIGGPVAAGMGLVSPLARASTSEDAAAAGGIGALRLANPVLGFIANQVNKVRTERAAAAAAEEARQAEAAAAAAPALPTPTNPVAPVTAPTSPMFDGFGTSQGNEFSGNVFGQPSRTLGGSVYGNNWGAGFGGANFSGGFGSSDSGDSDGSSSSTGTRQYADGGAPARGLVQGPGTGTSDSIQVPMGHISNGEYIVSADVVKALGVELFDALQAAFHKGGAPA